LKDLQPRRIPENAEEPSGCDGVSTKKNSLFHIRLAGYQTSMRLVETRTGAGHHSRDDEAPTSRECQRSQSDMGMVVVHHVPMVAPRNWRESKEPSLQVTQGDSVTNTLNILE
jgi:hypothetical protein